MLPAMTFTLPGLRPLRPLVPAIVLCLAAQPVAAQSAVTFSVPGAYTTQPLKVNNKGVVAGLYASSDVAGGAFVRDAKGVISTIHLADGTGFAPYMGLNISGTVVGAYLSTTVVARGFVRTPDGDITPFDIPGAGITVLTDINDRGAMVGAYLDATLSQGAGFIVSPRGEIEEVTGPGGHLYVPTAINTAGAITGLIQAPDGTAILGAFHRDARGEMSVIEIPSQPLDPAGTHVEVEVVSPAGINAAGTVTGEYRLTERAGTAVIATGFRGFLRHPDGSVETFAHPDSRTVYPWGTAYSNAVTGLDAAGDIVGHRYEPTHGGRLGYQRSRNGRFTTVAVEGSLSTLVLGTSPSGLKVGITYLPDYFETGRALGFIMR